MTTQAPQPLLRPCDVAKRLGCSEWWVKEQARKGRIPYTRIGGSYRFTEEHVVAIIQRFEVLPTDAPAPAPVAVIPQQVREPRATAAPVIELKSRTPRRARTAALNQAA